MKKSWATARELSLIGIALTFMILLAEHFTGFTVTALVPIFSILFSILWVFYLKKTSTLKYELKYYIMVDLPRMKGEMALFISAGFFGQAILNAGLSEHVLNFIHELGIQQAIPLSIFLFLTVIGLSLIGIHPFVSVLTFCISLSGSDVIVGKELFIAMVLLGAWPITTAISPFSGVVLMVSSIRSLSPFRVGLKENWLYALFVMISSLTFLNLLHYVFVL